MAAYLPPEVVTFLNKEKVFAHVATLMKDGSPQVTPVWVWTDGSHILINSSESSLKVRNLRRDGRIALSVMGSGNPRRTVTVRGRVLDITTHGALEDINRMSEHYTGHPYNGLRPSVERVTIKIEPLKVRSRL